MPVALGELCVGIAQPVDLLLQAGLVGAQGGVVLVQAVAAGEERGPLVLQLLVALGQVLQGREIR